MYRKTPYCNPCWAARNRAQYQKDREGSAAKAREYRKRNPHVVKKINANAQLKKMGVDMDWYEAKADSQGHLCAICGKRELAHGESRLSIDHDHACCRSKSSCENCRRDLLCRKCNLMLGCAGDDPSVLIVAAEYLKKWGKS